MDDITAVKVFENHIDNMIVNTNKGSPIGRAPAKAGERVISLFAPLRQTSSATSPGGRG